MIDYNQELKVQIKNSRILKSFTPEFKEDYKFSQCWHGCDKVSYLKEFSGGGGS